MIGRIITPALNKDLTQLWKDSNFNFYDLNFSSLAAHQPSMPPSLLLSISWNIWSQREFFSFYPPIKILFVQISLSSSSFHVSDIYVFFFTKKKRFWKVIVVVAEAFVLWNASHVCGWTAFSTLDLKGSHLAEEMRWDEMLKEHSRIFWEIPPATHEAFCSLSLLDDAPWIGFMSLLFNLWWSWTVSSFLFGPHWITSES